MYETASAGDDMSWQRAKAELITLYQRLRASPDLTSTDAERLFDIYRTELLRRKEIIKKTMLMGTLAEDFSARSRGSAENAVLNNRAAQVFELQ